MEHTNENRQPQVADNNEIENENLTLMEEFMKQHYEFRHNLLSDHDEYRKVDEKEFKVLTTEAWHGMMWRCIKALDNDVRKSDMELYLHSDYTPRYDPIAEWLHHLPQWDGKDHVKLLLNQLPGQSPLQQERIRLWLRSMVAHWLQMDTLHGNDTVLLIMGEQGCGKSTFCQRLLPLQLRNYFLDHLNLANKHDKEMALSHNLIVNIDEFDQVKPSQQAELKHTISKAKVNGRPIFGRTQKERPRYASFTATTNSYSPLKDSTGSRRYICVRIPRGLLIDNGTPIDYEQLYAQLMDEVVTKQMRYWFTNREVQALQKDNLPYQSMTDLSTMLSVIVEKPKHGEPCRGIYMKHIVDLLALNYPEYKVNQREKIKISSELRSQGITTHHGEHGTIYHVMPRQEFANAPLAS